MMRKLLYKMATASMGSNQPSRRRKENRKISKDLDLSQKRPSFISKQDAINNFWRLRIRRAYGIDIKESFEAIDSKKLNKIIIETVNKKYNDIFLYLLPLALGKLSGEISSPLSDKEAKLDINVDQWVTLAVSSRNWFIIENLLNMVPNYLQGPPGFPNKTAEHIFDLASRLAIQNAHTEILDNLTAYQRLNGVKNDPLFEPMNAGNASPLVISGDILNESASLSTSSEEQEEIFKYPEEMNSQSTDISDLAKISLDRSPADPRPSIGKSLEISKGEASLQGGASGRTRLVKISDPLGILEPIFEDQD